VRADNSRGTTGNLKRPTIREEPLAIWGGDLAVQMGGTGTRIYNITMKITLGKVEPDKKIQKIKSTNYLVQQQL